MQSCGLARRTTHRYGDRNGQGGHKHGNGSGNVGRLAMITSGRRLACQCRAEQERAPSYQGIDDLWSCRES